MSAQEIQENSIDAADAPSHEEVDDVSAPTPVSDEINTEAQPESVKKPPITGKRKYTKGPRSEGQKASLIKARAARHSRAADKSRAGSISKGNPGESQLANSGITAAHLSSVLDPFVELTHQQNKLLKQAYRGTKSRKRRYYESSESESEEEEYYEAPTKKSAPKVAARHPSAPDGPMQRPSSPTTVKEQKAAAPEFSDHDRQMYSFMRGLGF